MAAVALSAPVQAAPSTKIGTAPLVAPSAADAYYGGATISTNSTGASARPAEVQELARALKGDPDLIYEHVRNNASMVWTYGLTKGAMSVIVDRSGTAFDQAQLMVELLRQSGYTASYKVGTITLSGAQFASWSGITSATAACQLLSSGGIPATINGTTTADCSYGAATVTAIDVGHVWVAATIQGVSYVFDPAFKDHTFKTGIDLATATGMSAGMALSLGATHGAQSGVTYMVGYPNSTLTGNLATYANNLETAIDATAPSGGLADVVGGKSINAQAIPAGGLRQLTLPYTANVQRTIDGEAPDQYRTRLRVQLTKARPDTTTPGVIDKTLYVDEIYGRRLTFEPNFDTTGASFTGALKLTDEFGTAVSLGSVSYSDDPTYSRGEITLTVNLPYAAGSGAYMDAVVTRPVSYALPFTVVHGWGAVGRGLIDKWGQRRDTAMPASPDPTCKVCFNTYKAWKGDGRRETLAAAWLAQASRAGDLHAAIGKAIFAQHYSVGVAAADTVVFQTSNGSFWVTDSFDRLDVETGFSLTSVTANATERRGAVLAAAASLAALKGSVSGQISDLPDVSSTASRFEWGNAPPAATDVAGGVQRRFYEYASTANAAQAFALSSTENLTTTTETGVHPDGQDPIIGSAEVTERRQALADGVGAYVSDGFTVVASAEAFLGPGKRGGAFIPAGSNQYTHRPTPQRGGAIAAIRYDANGEPLEVANVIVNPGGLREGGGGAAQIYHQVQYDPATSADVVKGRFVNEPVGTVKVTSPAQVVSGAGSFPYKLTGSLIWQGGEARDETFGANGHREPQGGWTTNFTNTLTISGSGLEAMGETDVRAAAGTLAAFWAAQDAYRATPSLKREVAGQLITSWWMGRLPQNVASVSLGTETRQFVRRANGLWLAPGPAPSGTLTQTNSAVVAPRHPNIQHLDCSSGQLTYVPTRGWSYADVQFTVTGGKGDVQTFDAWTNRAYDGKCAEQRGFRLSTWMWLKGVQLTFNYARAADVYGISPDVETLSFVGNNAGQRLNFIGGGLGGLIASITNGSNLRQMTVVQTGSEVTHTDPLGAITKFDVVTMGTGDFAKRRIGNVFAADSATLPATTYIYDALARLNETRDRLVLAGSRAPTRYFLADGLRAEVLDPLGYRSIAYADPQGRPFRTIDASGAISTTVYDGRGKPILMTSPGGRHAQFEYNLRNLVTRTTRLARAGSAEAGQTLATETGWHATLNLPSWTKDAKGAQTDYVYPAGEIGEIRYPPALPGATRLSESHTYYTGGLPMAVQSPLGRSVSATYAGVSWNTMTDVVGSLSGVYEAVTKDEMGDPIVLKGARGGLSNITYDPLRRRVLTIEPLVGGAPRVATKVTYDLVGRVTKVERGSYSGTTFTPIETYSAEYDAVGNRLKEISPASVVQHSYDALNRPVCTAVRMNPQVYASLPADACVPSQSGTFGPDRISRVTYDPSGRVVQTESGVGSDLQQVTARYGYSPDGLKTSLTDANGNRSVFEYDGFDRLKRLRYPAAPRGSGLASATDYEEYGYDANGNRTSFRKRDGQVIAYQYDALNRVIVKDLPGTTADDVYYTHLDGARKVEARLNSPTNTVYFKQQFDEAGRLLSNGGGGSDGAGGGPFGEAGAQYDIAGNRTAVGSGGRDFLYTYDLAGRLTDIAYAYGGSYAGIAQIYYGPLNRRAFIARPNGVATSYLYDQAGRLTGLSHAGAASSAGSNQTFSYNPAGQLIGQGQASDQYVWSGQPTTTVNFTHDQLNRDAAMAAAAGYDANGNLISDGVRTFTYDAENRLRSVTGGASPVTLDYDPWGRLRKVTANGAWRGFYYYGSDLMGEAKLRSNGNCCDYPATYVQGLPGELLGWQEWTSPVAALVGQGWFHTDRLGSVIATSDADGAMTPYTYGPYGEPQSWAGSRFRYTGQMAIPEAQLYHYKARAYDPTMGRFLQTDPIGYEDGPNIYAYVEGDPVNAIDPSGTCGRLHAGQDECSSGGIGEIFRTVVSGISNFFAGGSAGGGAGGGGAGGGGAGGGGSGGGCAGCISELVVTAARPVVTTVRPVIVGGFATVGSSVIGGVGLAFVPTAITANDCYQNGIGTVYCATPPVPPPIQIPPPNSNGPPPDVPEGLVGAPPPRPPPEPPKNVWIELFGLAARWINGMANQL